MIFIVEVPTKSPVPPGEFIELNVSVFRWALCGCHNFLLFQAVSGLQLPTGPGLTSTHTLCALLARTLVLTRQAAGSISLALKLDLLLTAPLAVIFLFNCYR